MKQGKTVMLLLLRNKGAGFGHPGSRINERTWKSDGGGPKEAGTFLRREPKSPTLASCLHPRGPPTLRRDTLFCTTTLHGGSCLSTARPETLPCLSTPRRSSGGTVPLRYTLYENS